MVGGRARVRSWSRARQARLLSRAGLAWPGLAAVALGGLAAGCSSSPTAADDLRLGPLGDLLGASERVEIPGLSAPVDLVRDRHGRIHLYARTSTDAARAQGYAMARDRAVQLEVLRRIAQGRLAAWIGGSDVAVVQADLLFRHLGLARAAHAELDQLQVGSELRALLDGFSAGVTQAFRQLRSGERALPAAFADLPVEGLGDWSAEDSLAVARLQAWLGSYSADEELGRQKLLLDLGATFAASSSAPALARRAGMARDFLRFEPVEAAATVPLDLAPVSAHLSEHPLARGQAPERRLAAAADPGRMRRLLDHAGPAWRASARVRDWLAPAGAFGSNGWAIAPELSATGHALLASDPHGALSAPAAFWPVSLHVVRELDAPSASDEHVAGVAFPGVPAVVVGHNAHVAWGTVATRYDVTDLYAETLSADGTGVRFQGGDVPFETLDERIDVRGGDSIATRIYLVPHHGPLLPTIEGTTTLPPDPEAGAISVRWTGLEPDGDRAAWVGLARSSSVAEANAALASYRIGGQGFVLADDVGTIAWTSPASLPERDPRALGWSAESAAGLLPCLVLPGDGTAEWLDRWPASALPAVREPLGGYVSAANNDPVGGTFDGDPSDDLRVDGGSAYLGCEFDPGLRQARIQRLIEGRTGLLGPAELAAMQNDARSAIGARLGPALLLAILNAQHEHSSPGAHPMLAAVVSDPAYDPGALDVVAGALATWRDESDYLAASGVDPASGLPLGLELREGRAAQATLLFHAWLVRLLALTFGDELALVGLERGSPAELRALLYLLAVEPAALATYDPATQDSALWDDLGTLDFREARQERMIRALLDALGRLGTALGPELGSYRWGMLHTLRLEALVPGHPSVAIPSWSDPLFPGGFARHGDGHTIDLSPFPLEHAAGDELDLSSGAGPVQRLVVDLDPAGPRARFSLAGGASEDPESPHAADEAAGWQRGELHDVPFALDEVIAAAESRMVVVPPR
jgi:penicillin amidase